MGINNLSINLVRNILSFKSLFSFPTNSIAELHHLRRLRLAAERKSSLFFISLRSGGGPFLGLAPAGDRSVRKRRRSALHRLGYVDRQRKLTPEAPSCSQHAVPVQQAQERPSCGSTTRKPWVSVWVPRLRSSYPRPCPTLRPPVLLPRLRPSPVYKE